MKVRGVHIFHEVVLHGRGLQEKGLLSVHQNIIIFHFLL